MQILNAAVLFIRLTSQKNELDWEISCRLLLENLVIQQQVILSKNIKNAGMKRMLEQQGLSRKPPKTDAPALFKMQQASAQHSINAVGH
jgi:hypothetical protein